MEILPLCVGMTNREARAQLAFETGEGCVKQEESFLQGHWQQKEDQGKCGLITECGA